MQHSHLRTRRSPHASFFAQDTWAKYLKEGMNVNVLTWNGKVSAWSSPGRDPRRATADGSVCRAGDRR